MTLWNIIRDFFVQYIFGGTTSTGAGYFDNFIGNFGTSQFNYIQAFDIQLPLNALASDNDLIVNYMSLGDWLSTTATIITLCAICVFLFLFVRWLFRLTAGLFQARG